AASASPSSSSSALSAPSRSRRTSSPRASAAPGASARPAPERSGRSVPSAAGGTLAGLRRRPPDAPAPLALLLRAGHGRRVLTASRQPDDQHEDSDDRPRLSTVTPRASPRSWP